MVYSRLSRYEQKKQIKRLVWAVGGSIAILLFLGIFGLKLLEGFSLLVAKFKGSTPVDTQNALVLAPTLDDTFEATNTAVIKMSGRTQPKLKVLAYINEEEKDTVTVADDGTFTIDPVNLKEGDNTVSVKAKDEKGNTSDLSNVVHIAYKKSGPVLELESPADNASVIGEKNTVTISGKTDTDATLTVNDRVIVTQSGGSFSTDYRLSDGSNTIKVVATDQAGNKTTVERTVTYQH
jgi:bacillopeptidase F